MKKLKKISFIVLIEVIATITILYILTYYSLRSYPHALFGICLPGQKLYNDRLVNKCYTQSVYEGKSCLKKTDCGTAWCVLEKGKGTCRDLAKGCIAVLDENGKENPFTCID